MREFKDRVVLITPFSFDPDLNIRVAEITPLVRGQNRHFDPVSLTLYRIKQNRLPFLTIHPSQTKDMALNYVDPYRKSAGKPVHRS